MLIPSLMVLDGPVIWLMFGMIFFVGIPTLIVLGVLKLKSSGAFQGGPQTSAPPPPTLAYKVSRAGQVIGTYDAVAIQHLIRAGAILRTDDYWAAGMTEWQKVGSRAEWFPPSA